MTSKLLRASTFVALGTLAGYCPAGHTQGEAAAWLDVSKPAAWNEPGQSIPDAPVAQGANPRCLKLARPAELEEDRRIQERGWQLDGAYQGGWQIVVMRGTSHYDGMCRPWEYQVFVFVRGSFAGTLSPKPMDSRIDGALTQVFLEGPDRLMAEYARYRAKDPLCCPSRTTRVTFAIASDPLVVRPLSSITSPNKR